MNRPNLLKKRLVKIPLLENVKERRGKKREEGPIGVLRPLYPTSPYFTCDYFVPGRPETRIRELVATTGVRKGTRK